LNLDEHNHGSNGRRRSGRLQRDAQWAVLGIAFDRVHVRHLGHGQQRHQGEAQQRGSPESAWLPAAAYAEIWLQPCQQNRPLLQEYID
jgi:hypothetical protein